MRTGLYNLTYLFVGTGLGALSGFLVQIILARHTSPEIFGNYSAMLATVTTLAPLAGFGIAQFWLKVSGQFGPSAVVYITKSLKFVVVSSIMVFVILVSWFIFTIESPRLKLAGCVLSIFIMKRAASDLINSLLQIQRRYLFMSLWQVFQSAFLLAILLSTIYILRIELDELIISSIQAFIAISCIFILTPTLIHFINEQRNQKNQLAKHSSISSKDLQLISIAKDAAPFGVAGLFYLIYYQLGVVFVRHINGAEQAGFYSIASTFLAASLLVPNIIYQKYLLPKLHQWAYHDQVKFLRSYYYGNYIMLVLGVGVMLLLWILAPFLVHTFFGETYISSVSLVRIMSINIPIAYIASSAGSLLVTQNHMRIKVIYMGITAIISLILNIPLIKIFGTSGAIYTNIICNFFILIACMNKINKDFL